MIAQWMLDCLEKIPDHSGKIAQLKVFRNSDMITDEDVQAYKDAMTKKEKEQQDKKILENHPYKLWYVPKEDCWKTYLPDATKKNRRVQKQCKTEEAIKKLVIDFYKKKEEEERKKKERPKDFKSAYYKWRESHDVTLADNSQLKYDTDYQRYFEGTEFEKMLVKDITEEDIVVFICKTTKNQKLCQKATKTLFGYVNNTIRSARMHDRSLTYNPMEFLKAKDFYRYCTNVERPADKEVLTSEESQQLYVQLQKDHEKKPNYMPSYAVEFSMFVGCRVAEISALKWECIHKEENCIKIKESEKYNRRTKIYTIEETKTKTKRDYPLTPELEDLLNRVKKVKEEYGYKSEFVFSNEEGRIHAHVISSCIKNKSRQLELSCDKSIHQVRRTVNSVARSTGVSCVDASRLMGHSPRVNEEHYTRQVNNTNSLMNVMITVNEKMVNGW